MSWREFADMLGETVTLEPWQSQDQWGEPTYAAGRAYPARVEMRSRMIAGRDGKEVAARGRVFVGMDAVPSVKDRLTLPAAYSPQQPPLLDVAPVRDEAGLHHVVLWFGG